jgi:hypothetical protein
MGSFSLPNDMYILLSADVYLASFIPISPDIYTHISREKDMGINEGA